MQVVCQIQDKVLLINHLQVTILSITDKVFIILSEVKSYFCNNGQTG